MTIKIKWLFLIVWLLSLVVFIVGQLSAPSNYASITGNPWGAIFGTSVVIGMLSFVLMVGFFAYDLGKGVKPKKEVKKFNWKFFKHPLSLIIALLLLLAFEGTTLAYKYMKLNGSNISTIFQKATPSPIPLPTVFITPAPTSTPNLNPVITCNIAKECGGGSQQLKKSVCDNKICCLYDSKCGGPKFVNKSECGTNITCCGLNDGSWTLMDNDKCTQVHNANKPVVNTTTVVTQPSTGLNFYCYDNTLKYSFYTSSGEACNKANYISACKKLAESTVFYTCADQCKVTNASVGYAECLQNNCSQPYQDALSKCNNY